MPSVGIQALFVARLSALPAEATEVLRSRPLFSELDRLFELERSIAMNADGVSQVLYTAIGRETSRAARNVLLHTRRKLFNRQRTTASHLAVLERTMQVEDLIAVRAFDDLLEAREELLRTIRQTHSIALTRSRREFQRAIGDERFRNGVLLSSASLFRNLARYSEADAASLASRDEQIERGLLRYFTRTSMKATPFATFCTVIAGDMVDASASLDSNANAITIVGDPAKQITGTRLNKALYGILWPHLKQRPAVQRALLVDLNPTLHVAHNRWVFLAALGPPSANIE